MTTIVFRKIYDDIEIAYDTQTTQGNAGHQTTVEKVFVNNDTILAVSGSTAAKSAIKHADLPEYSHSDPEFFVVRELLPAIRKALAPLDLGDEAFEVIAVVDGEIFESYKATEANRNVNEVYATGSGWQLALGALAMGGNARDAVNVAGEYDIYTSGAVSTTARTLLGTLPTTGPLLVEAPFEAVAA